MFVTLNLVWRSFELWNSVIIIKFLVRHESYVMVQYLFWLQYIEDVKAGKPKFHYGTIKKR